jgi:hypothetical protein
MLRPRLLPEELRGHHARHASPGNRPHYNQEFFAGSQGRPNRSIDETIQSKPRLKDGCRAK